MATSLFASAVKSSMKILCQPVRLLSVTPSHRIKEVTVTKVDKQTIIEGRIIESPWKGRELKVNSSGCVLCALNLDVKHTDVLIISQFVRSDGCMLPRRVTGLCKTQQRRVGTMVAMAQKAGLMSNLTPANSKKDPTRRKEWKKFNTYYDETTIRPPRQYRKKSNQLLKYV